MNAAPWVRCRSCDAPVFWVRTERGKRMPFDWEAYEGDDSRGLFVIHSGIALAVGPLTFPGEPLYRSHFATCPHADQWRRRASDSV